MKTGIISRIKYLSDISINEVSLERLSASVYRRLRHLPHSITWSLPFPFAKENKNKINRFKNKHCDQRCFIIANGPSLNNIDLSLIKNEITIGMNRIYLLEQTIQFLPTYLVCIDVMTQLEQFTQEYQSVEATCFYNWASRRLFENRDSIHYINPKFKPTFSTDITERIWGGHSVTFACMQIAFFMGFKEVILIGKDHSYKDMGKPGDVIKSTGEEENHFIKGYFKKNMKWRIPDYKGEEFAYRMAKEMFEKEGRIILDATIGGKLNVFEKVNYFDLF